MTPPRTAAGRALTWHTNLSPAEFVEALAEAAALAQEEA